MAELTAEHNIWLMGCILLMVSGKVGNVLNATLILVPATFIYITGNAYWEILLRARVIENQCYVLAPPHLGP